MKSIVSGDTIDGNRKFCDSHPFTPRAKVVCSSNKMLKVNDDSYGMKRRLMFCSFKACFKNCADGHLLDKLKAELPGIFNRVYRAYKALLDREQTQGSNAIRPSIDQLELIGEFVNITNPVSAFWQEHGQEFIERREVPKAEVFDAYREFCERNGLFPGLEMPFHKSLQKVFDEKGVTWDFTRHRENGKQTYYYTLLASPDWRFKPD